jgi:uncharacterized delta-60 repeat protein
MADHPALHVLLADDHAMVRDGLRSLIEVDWPEARFTEARDQQCTLAALSQTASAESCGDRCAASTILRPASSRYTLTTMLNCSTTLSDNFNRMMLVSRFPKHVLQLLVSLAFSAVALLARPTFAAAGDPDGIYGTSGVDEVKASLMQYDSKLVVAGNCVRPGDSVANSFCLARVNPDGSLDVAGFNSADVIPAQRGKAFLMPTSSNNELTSAFLRSDGRILVAGNCQGAPGARTVCIAQFKSDGTLDESFATGGLFVGPVAQSLGLWSDVRVARVVATADGSVLVAAFRPGSGSGDPASYSVFKLSSGGALDTTSGTPASGQLTTGLLYAVVDAQLQANGQIYYVGTCDALGLNQACLQRINAANATVDSTLGQSGLAATRFAADMATTLSFRVTSAALQNDGRILLGAGCGNNYSAMCLARMTTTGAPDNAFNAGLGYAQPPTPGPRPTVSSPGAESIVVQPDGRIVVSGQCPVGGQELGTVPENRLCVMRTLADGRLDPSFGAGGVTMSSPGGADPRGRSATLQSDGKIVVAGSCTGSTNTDYCASRFEGRTQCTMDVDGDGQMLATIDALIVTRVMLGMSGDAVIGGINLPANAKRSSWSQIRDYLVHQCGMTISP